MSVRVSVAMAVYNGEKHLEDQLNSIITQLNTDDELVISYNDSSDNTWNILRNYSEIEERIKLLKCKESGVISNFNNAIENCSGEYIFLADQDDVWYPDKIEKCIYVMESNDATTAMHDTEIVNKDLELIGQSLFVTRNAKIGFLKNILQNSYQGCCMVFKAELVPYICPIPKHVPMHDQWIGLVSEYYGKVVLINEKLIAYRRHDSNVTSSQLSISKKIMNRTNLIKILISRILINKTNFKS